MPGGLIQRGSGQESLTAMRSPVLTGAGSCGAFVFLENSVPIRPVGFCNVNEMLEINTEQAEALEILRGPGGALYGSNSVHGTINVLQPGPSRESRPASNSRAGPPITAALASLAARVFDRGGGANLQAFYTHDGGWRDESGYDEAKLNALAIDRRPTVAPIRSRRHRARPGNGGLHHRQGCVPRRGPARDQPESRGVPQGARGAAHRPGPAADVPARSPRIAAVPAHLAHGVPAALPARASRSSATARKAPA